MLLPYGGGAPPWSHFFKVKKKKNKKQMELDRRFGFKTLRFGGWGIFFGGGGCFFIAIALQTGSSAFRDKGLRFSGQRTRDRLRAVGCTSGHGGGDQEPPSPKKKIPSSATRVPAGSGVTAVQGWGSSRPGSVAPGGSTLINNVLNKKRKGKKKLYIFRCAKIFKLVKFKWLRSQRPPVLINQEHVNV